MKKTILLLLVVLIFCLKSVYAEDYFGLDNVNPFSFNNISGFSIVSQSSSKDHSRVGMADPAAVYCYGLDYDYKIINTENGQYGICIFPDGSQCEEWQFLEGLCGQSFSYCALNGYDIITKSDGNSHLSATYSVCVNKITREEIGSVINLFGLVGKSVRSEKSVTEQVSSVSEQTISTESILAPLPSYFDWRNMNGDWTTGVKDQGICGACWAFATVGTVEAEYEVFTNNPDANLDLSEEYLVSDCLQTGRAISPDDCCGGHESDAHDFFRNNGVPDEGCLGYVDANCGCNLTCGDNGSCTYHSLYTCSNAQCFDRCSDWQSRLIKTDYSGSISSGNIQEIKEKIFTNGPVTAEMGFSFATPDANGIFRCNDNDVFIDHIIVLVGWNDTGQFWIAKNSFGSGLNDGGYFNVAYGDCAIEKKITYDSGFNMVDSGNDVQEFYSQPSPANSYPISCISQSAIWDSESRYGDDDIEEITFDGDKCKIVGDDTSGPYEQSRYVGVVSLPQDSIPSPPITTWSSWEFRNQSGHCDGPDCLVETFSSPTCPSGYFPASCLSETADEIDQGKYGEDNIIGITIGKNISSNPPCSCWGPCPSGTILQCNPVGGQCCTPTPPNVCKVTAFDSVTPDPEYYRRTGTVCLPDVNPNILWGDWSLRNDSNGYHDGDNADVETFYGPICPSGSFPISCLSQSAAWESEEYYGEDSIVNIRIYGGRCVITANDETGSFEQKRRVATVCKSFSPIYINSPENEGYYYKTYIPLSFVINLPTSSVSYSLDGQPNVSISSSYCTQTTSTSCSINLTRITDGYHSIIVFFNDVSGNTYFSDTFNFYYCAGDWNKDRKRDARDVSFVASLFGIRSCNDLRYNTSIDMNDDCRIDARDVSFVSSLYGKRCS